MADDFEKELSKSEKLLKERLVRAGKVAKDITDKAFKELVSTIDDYSNSLNDITDALNEQLGLYDDIKSSTRQYGDALKSTIPFLKDNKDLSQKLISIYSQQNKITDKLVENQEELLKGQLSSQDVAKDISKIQTQQLNIELAQRNIANEMQIVQNSMVGLQEEELEKQLFKLEALKEINEQLEAEKENTQKIADNLSNQAKSVSQIETKVGVAGKLLKGFSKIPVIGDALDLKGAEDAMKAMAATGASGFQTLAAGAKALGPSLSAALGPLGLILAGIQAIVSVFNFFKDAMFEADKRITSLSRNLQLTKEETEQIDSYFKSIKGSLENQSKLTKDLYQAQTELSTLTSTVAFYNKENLDAQTQLTKEYKLQTEEASNLNKFFLLGNKTATENLDIAAETTSQFFKQTGVLFNERKLLEQASKVSGQLLVSFKGSTAELIKSVAQANKLGITLDQAKNISESMLNFEESISSELEAELLTGKDLNLDRARALSLQGKYAEAAEEALKNVGSLAEFQEMNVIQQQALAKAAGLTVDQLSDALVQQKLIDKTQKQTYENYKTIFGEEYARRYALGELSAKEIEDSNRRLDAQEKFNIALERVQEIFTDLVTGGTLDTLANVAMSLADTLSSGGSLFSLFGESDLDKNIKKRELESAQKTREELEAKTKESGPLTELEQKRLAKAVETIILNQTEGDGNARKAAIASGKIKIEPLSREEAGMKFADGAIIKSPVYNATVGEAGPEAIVPLNEFYAKLDQLINATKSGKDIYIDSSKVTGALELTNYKSNY